MKMSLFTNPEQFADWALRQAELVENNGLKVARELYYRALEGKGKTEFLKMNRIPAESADEVWEHHIDWLEKDVEALERKVRKYRRDAKKALQNA